MQQVQIDQAKTLPSSPESVTLAPFSDLAFFFGAIGFFLPISFSFSFFPFPPSRQLSHDGEMSGGGA